MVSDVVYTIGGSSSGVYHSSMETINPKTESEWKQEAMPFSGSGICVATIGKNKIVVTGGYDGKVSK